jgi:hypothetical protein
MRSPEQDPFLRLVAALTAAGVRFVVIGVAGINYYGPTRCL